MIRTSIALLCLLLLSPVFERTIGAQWKRVTCPGSPTPVNYESPHRNPMWLNGALYAGVGSSLYRSTNSGDSWQTLADWQRDVKWEERWQLAAHGSTLIATVFPRWTLERLPPDWYAHLHVVRSTDGGLTWRDTTTLTGYAPLPTTVTPGRVIIPHGDIRNSVIHFTTDGGVSWDSTKSEGLGNYSTAAPTDVIAKGSLLFLSTMSDSLETSLFKSTDYGETWTPVTTGFTTEVSGSSYIEKLLLVGNTLLAVIYAGGNTAIISTDDGQTWSTLPVLHRVQWTNGKALFGNIAGGLGVIALNGASWKLWNEGLPAGPYGPEPYVFNMTFSDSLAFLELAASGQTEEYQFWKRPLSELLTGVDERTGDASPSVISLSQNYPNPFNPSTTIRYGLPNRSQVTLTIFNTIGQQVALLQNGEQEAGYHEVRFDGKNLSSGVYVYRIQAGEFVATKRLLLLH